MPPTDEELLSERNTETPRAPRTSIPAFAIFDSLGLLEFTADELVKTLPGIRAHIVVDGVVGGATYDEQETWGNSYSTGMVIRIPGHHAQGGPITVCPSDSADWDFVSVYTTAEDRIYGALDFHEVYALAAARRHRSASRKIFELFRNMVDGPHESEIPDLLNTVDVSRLTSFEIKTLLVATRPVVGTTSEYRSLRARCVKQAEEELGVEAATSLLRGF